MRRPIILSIPAPSKPRESAISPVVTLISTASRGEEGRRQLPTGRRHPYLIRFPLSPQDAGSIPIDYNLFHAVSRRERDRPLRHPGASPERRRQDITSVAIDLDQTKLSHRANIFPSSSSPKAPKNPRGWCAEEGDRPPSFPTPVAVAIADSFATARWLGRAGAVVQELSTVAELFHAPPPPS